MRDTPAGIDRRPAAPRATLRMLRTALLVVLLASAACSRGVATYGDVSGAAERVSIGALLGSPELHLGREIRVSGRIVQVCQVMGCWFEVMQEDRRLMVDLQMGRSFVIPEGSAGAWAVVTGTFVRDEGVLKILAKGAEIQAGPPV
jgi:hypothetical protein